MPDRPSVFVSGLIVQGVFAEDALALELLPETPPLGDAFSACCRPGSWEWNSAWGAALRGALERRGYRCVEDPTASWRRRWELVELLADDDEGDDEERCRFCDEPVGPGWLSACLRDLRPLLRRGHRVPRLLRHERDGVRRAASRRPRGPHRRCRRRGRRRPALPRAARQAAPACRTARRDGSRPRSGNLVRPSTSVRVALRAALRRRYGYAALRVVRRGLRRAIAAHRARTLGARSYDGEAEQAALRRLYHRAVRALLQAVAGARAERPPRRTLSERTPRARRALGAAPLASAPEPLGAPVAPRLVGRRLGGDRCGGRRPRRLSMGHGQVSGRRRRALASRAFGPELRAAPAVRPVPLPAAPALGAVGARVLAASRAPLAPVAPSTHRTFSDVERMMRLRLARVGLELRIPMTVDECALVVAALADAYKVNTITLCVQVIRRLHRAAGFESPTESTPVLFARRELRRVPGKEGRPTRPVRLADLAQALRLFAADAGAGDLHAARDRAMLLLLYATAARPHEATIYEVEDVELERRGFVATLRRSKTNQGGPPYIKAVSYNQRRPDLCPVRALRAWRELLGRSTGPLFPRITYYGPSATITREPVKPERVCTIVEKRLAAAGIDGGGHGLRAGFMSDGGDCGIELIKLMRQSGHEDVATAVRYIRRGAVWRQAPTAELWARVDYGEASSRKGRRRR